MIDGLINIKKREQFYNIITEIQEYQKKPYDSQYNGKLGPFLEEIPHHNSEMLYSLSLLVLPKKE